MATRSIVIAPLARHREHVARLASWFRQEWPAWYGPGGPGNAEADMRAFASSDSKLPVGLLALRDGEPVGVGALKPESLPTHRHLTPWAAAGFVLPAYRGQGVGAMLLAALVRHASDLGYATVYCGTASAINLLRRSGWCELERIEYEGEQLAIFRKTASVIRGPDVERSRATAIDSGSHAALAGAVRGRKRVAGN
jgi:GNAT superfamily N-acetyltransferase